MSSARDRILPPYTRRVTDFRHVALKSVAMVSVVLFAMFMGFWLALFSTFVAMPFAAILFLLLLLALWMAPETDMEARPQIEWLFLAFVGIGLVWPTYIAVDAPGLPWITPVRLAFAFASLLFLLQLSQSRATRAEVADLIRLSKPGFILYGIFLFAQVSTIALASNPASTAASVAGSLVLWNFPFLLAIWLMTRDGALLRLNRVLLFSMAFTLLLCLVEYQLRRPVWTNYIPPFLKVDPKLMATFLSEQVRVGDLRYRVRGNHGIHLYFAQVLAMTLPFALHAMLTARPDKRVYAAGLFALVVVIAWITNTRTAMLGIFSGMFAYGALFSWRRYRRPLNKGDVAAPMALVAGAGAILLLIGLILTSHRVRMATIGGHVHTGSNDVRQNQWAKAFDALLRNPFGYGEGNAGWIAGSTRQDGTPILDSSWIVVMLDYGVLGVIGFFGFLLWAIWKGVQMYVDAKTKEEELTGPVAIGLLAMILTMATVGYNGNQWLMMIMAGVLVARWSITRRAAASLDATAYALGPRPASSRRIPALERTQPAARGGS